MPRKVQSRFSRHILNLIARTTVHVYSHDDVQTLWKREHNPFLSTMGTHYTHSGGRLFFRLGQDIVGQSN
jgi:hypothetical protein